MARVNNSVSKKHQKAHLREVAKRGVKKKLLSKKAGQRQSNRSAVCLTSGHKMDRGQLQRLGRGERSEAPGPYYTPTDHLTRGRHLHIARKAVRSRVAVFDLARLSPVNLAKVFVGCGILPDLSGQCRECCKGAMGLAERRGQGASIVIAGVDIAPVGYPVWRCSNRGCKVRQTKLDPNGPLDELFQDNTVNSTKTLLGIAQALTVHGTGYASSYELAVHVGIGRQGAEHIARVVRGLCAQAAQQEQDKLVWKPGSLIEIDEGAMRVERVKCPRACKAPSCGGHPFGKYRLLHHRFLAAIPRGQRQLAKVVELPQETCEAGAGGVPLSAAEADAVLPKLLKGGPFTILTDGAGAYQSLAPEDRVAHHTEDKAPSFSAARFKMHYSKLKLSHGIVSHSAEQWATVGRVKVIAPSGATKTIKLKKGTQVVDGMWPEMRSSIPDAIHTTDWERCREYIWAFVWRMRRTGLDPFEQFGEVCRSLR